MDDSNIGDLALSCVTCGATFVWTVGQQAYFRDKKLATPRRCKPCRLLRRQERDAAIVTAFERAPMPEAPERPARSGRWRRMD